MSFTDATYTTAASDPKLPTIAETLAAMDEFNRKFPPLPPPDPKRCLNCKEEMDEPRMGVSGEPHVFDTPIGYLCGRCAYMMKQKVVYGLRPDIKL